MTNKITETIEAIERQARCLKLELQSNDFAEVADIASFLRDKAVELEAAARPSPIVRAPYADQVTRYIDTEGRHRIRVNGVDITDCSCICHRAAGRVEPIDRPGPVFIDPELIEGPQTGEIAVSGDRVEVLVPVNADPSGIVAALERGGMVYADEYPGVDGTVLELVREN